MNRDLTFRMLVFILSITQFISPIFSSFNDNQSTNKFDPPITPAGYTFAVWGIITLLGLCYGIYQLIPNRSVADLHQKVAIRISIVYFLFSVWLFAASRDWLWFTVAVFVIMFGLLFKLFQIIQNNRQKLTLADKILLEGQIGIYLGWSTVAIFANTASALAYYDLFTVGNTGIFIQATLLILALLNGIYGISKTNGNLFLAATILWAFIGIFVGLKQNSNTEMLQLVVVSAIVVFITYLAFIKLKLTRS
ncbi:MAG: hypothetical protein HC821_00345 [Lewinella sp.]|nr:hypothetical protein [Lewinella sp.]